MTTDSPIIFSYLGWGLLNHLFPFRCFPRFNSYRNIRCLLVITFIFDRCHHGLAAVTLHKYKSDSKNLTYTFAKSKFSPPGKITRRALMPPPGSLSIIYASRVLDQLLFHDYLLVYSRRWFGLFVNSE